MAKVNVDVYTDTHGSEDKLEEVGKNLDKVEKKAKKAGDVIKGFGKASTVMGGAIVGAFALMVKSASEAEEIESKFFAVFKEESAAATQYIENFAASTGRSRVDLMEWMSTLQDTFVPLGFARSEANKFSQTLTTLAVDLASFNNQAEPDVIRDLQSAIVGNHETMRKYGVIINEASINQELLNMGLADGKKNATEAQKAQARLNIIMRSTADAQGDAERTSGSFANQLRALQAQFRDLSVSIGQQVLPMISEFIQKIVVIIKRILEWIKAHPDLAKKIATTALKVGVLLAVLGPILIIIPKLVAGIVMLKGAFVALAGPIGLIVAAATTAYVIFMKLKKAKDELIKAEERLEWQTNRLSSKLEIISSKAGLTRQEFTALTQKYNDNYIALAMAIKHGKEGIKLQKAMAEIGAENVKEWKKQEDAQHKVSISLDPGLTSALKNAGTETATLTKLVKTMTDEVKKHTLDEFTFRKEKALQIYNERKAVLDKEKADQSAYALAYKAYLLELNAIEKDRTEKIKSAYKERGQAMMEYFNKQRELNDMAEGYVREYTDSTMQLTRSESEYRIWALDQWYKAEIEKLKPLLANYDAYIKAKAALDENYKAQTEQLHYELSQRISEHWQMIIDGISGSFGSFIERMLEGQTSLKDNFKALWDDIKSTFISTIADMARQWMANFIKQLITGATQAGASITASLGTAVSSLGAGLVSLVSAVAQSLVAVAQAIATAASILASAAAALATVGALAIALYAAFTLVKGIVNKLLGGGGAGDVVSRLDHMTEHLSNIQGGTDMLKTYWGDFYNTTKRIEQLSRDEISILSNIRSNTRQIVEKLDSLTGAQVGEVINQPSLRVVGEKAPAEKEFITPEPMFRSMLEQAAMQGGGSRQVNLTIMNEFRIEGQVDPNFTQKFVRDQVMPKMAEALDTNYMKTMLKEKLGI